MKITHNQLGNNLNIREQVKPDATDSLKNTGVSESLKAKGDALRGAGADSAGQVALSSRAQDIKRAREIANAVPDVDSEKVARLQKLIDQGEYKVDAKAIADKMIDEQANWE